MKIGLVYPQTEYPCDPAAVRDYAQAAEELGFSHILAYDHVLGANPQRPAGWQGPYTDQHPFMEPLLLFTYMAAITAKIEFTTGIIILPQRQTALFAKQAAVLDVLCQGRLRLGVGLGWNAVEYQALNESFSNRGRRIEEQIDVLRRLWTDTLVKYHGRWHHIDDAGLNPMPLQRPIPLWFGGHAEPALRRAARLGDGWMPNYRQASDAAAALALIDSELAQCGRSRKQFGIEARLHYGAGNPQEWIETGRAWKVAGATHISFNTMGAGLDSSKKHLAAVRQFAEIREALDQA